MINMVLKVSLDKILDKYTREEINKLHDKVWADGKPHYSF